MVRIDWGEIRIVGFLREANPDLEGNICLVLEVDNRDYASAVIKVLRSMQRRGVVVKIKEV